MILSDEPEGDANMTVDEEDDGARRENQEPPCAECQACYEQRETVSGGLRSWDDIPELLSLDEIDRYPELLFSTKGQHIADLDNLRAFYDLEGIPVRCSLEGAHRHGFGVVVKMLCGQTLRMGKVCGRKSIINFKEIFADLERRRNFQSDKRTLEGWPERYLARLSGLRRPLQLRYKWLQTLRYQLPELFAALKRRHGLGARGTEVTISRGEPVRSDIPEELRAGAAAEVIRHLRGLPLVVNSPPDFAALEAALMKYRAQANVTAVVDGATAQALMKLAGKADSRAAAADEWVRDTADFVAPDNLRLALVVLGQDNPSVEESENEIRVSYMGASGTFALK